MALTQVAIDYLDFDAAIALAEQVAAHVDDPDPEAGT